MPDGTNKKKSENNTIKVALVIAILTVAPYLHEAWKTYTFIHTQKREIPEYRDAKFPQLADLWVSVASAVAIQLIKSILAYLLPPIVRAIRSPKAGESAEAAKIEERVG